MKEKFDKIKQKITYLNGNQYYILYWMPLDYSKTYIYKICCRDINITEIYAGMTTNFAQRLRMHRSDCANQSSKNYNAHVYTFIRDNGGWENWDMILVGTISATSKLEAHKAERGYIESLKAALNRQIPTHTRAECKPEYTREWREANKDKIKEYNKQYKATRGIKYAMEVYSHGQST